MARVNLRLVIMVLLELRLSCHRNNRMYVEEPEH